MSAAMRVLGWSLTIGAVCFAAGFFGPMVLAPDANQGPLLGIFITGPLGLLVGGLFGLWKEFRRSSGGGSGGAPAGAAEPADYSQLLRGLAAGAGIFLAVRGVMGLRLAEGRGAAAAIVLSVAALWYAATGRIPAWFRR